MLLKEKIMFMMRELFIYILSNTVRLPGRYTNINKSYYSLLFVEIESKS